MALSLSRQINQILATKKDKKYILKRFHLPCFCKNNFKTNVLYETFLSNNRATFCRNFFRKSQVRFKFQIQWLFKYHFHVFMLKLLIWITFQLRKIYISYKYRLIDFKSVTLARQKIRGACFSGKRALANPAWYRAMYLHNHRCLMSILRSTDI